MKSFIALSLFVASTMAQYPGYTYGYAPSFGYAAYGTPAQVPASTAPLARVAAPAPAFAGVYSAAYGTPFNAYAAYGAYPYQQSLYNPYFGYNAYPFAPAAAALATPAVLPKAVEVPAAAAAAAVEVADAAAVELEDVDVVEADSTPLTGEGPVTLRAIFPIFGGDDLRTGGSANIVFARPDEIKAVPALTPANEEEGVTVVGAPNFSFRSFGAPAVAANAFAPANRFYYQQSPVIAF